MPDIALICEEMVLERPAFSRMDDYFGAWSMMEDRFNGLQSLISRSDMSEHVAKSLSKKIDDEEERAGYRVTQDGVAIFEVNGTMMRHTSSFSSGTSTAMLRSEIRKASRDSSVVAALFLGNTPGGTVDGTDEFAREIKNLSEKMPVAWHFDGMTASAGYWAASQCPLITCGPTAIGGSIGTYMTVTDYSGQADDEHIKVHIVRAGEFKGMGTPGTEITDKHLAEWQQMVNDLNAQFVKSALIEGRKMSAKQAESLATGRVYVGQAAVDAGLVDRVQSVDQTISDLLQQAKPRSTKGTKVMSTTTATTVATETVQTPQGVSIQAGADAIQSRVLHAIQGQALVSPASLAQIKAACYGADNDFLVAQLEAGVTLAEAKDNWIAALAQKNAEAKAANEKLIAEQNAQIAKLKAEQELVLSAKADESKPKRGVPHFEITGLSAASNYQGDPISEFKAMQADLVAKGTPFLHTSGIIAARNPELHQAFLFASQQGSMEREMKLAGVFREINKHSNRA